MITKSTTPKTPAERMAHYKLSVRPWVIVRQVREGMTPVSMAVKLARIKVGVLT